jgi:hypothetical protein
MDHLIAGERNPRVLAQLARARARRKISELEAALLAAMLARIDRASAEIARLTGVIERLLEPCEEQLQQAESMPGWGRLAAQDALAETGVDMSRFPTGAHLASWAGRYLGGLLGETAVAAGKTQTREGAATGGWPAAGEGQSPGRRGEHSAEGLPRPAVSPRHPVSGSRPGLLRTPGQHPPAGRPPRRQARRPRLRSHTLPHPRTRTRTPPGKQPPGRRTTSPHHQRTSEPAPPALPRAQPRSFFRVSSTRRNVPARALERRVDTHK